MRRIITPASRAALVRLFQEMRQLQARESEIQEEVEQITLDDEDNGLTFDALFNGDGPGEADALKLIEELGIEVRG